MDAEDIVRKATRLIKELKDNVLEAEAAVNDARKDDAANDNNDLQDEQRELTVRKREIGAKIKRVKVSNVILLSASITDWLRHDRTNKEDLGKESRICKSTSRSTTYRSRLLARCLMDPNANECYGPERSSRSSTRRERRLQRRSRGVDPRWESLTNKLTKIGRLVTRPTTNNGRRVTLSSITKPSLRP